jgi:hypothetical protein
VKHAVQQPNVQFVRLDFTKIISNAILARLNVKRAQITQVVLAAWIKVNILILTAYRANLALIIVCIAKTDHYAKFVFKTII